MKADVNKIRIYMAQNCITTNDICKYAKMSKTTFGNIVSGRSIRPVTLGRIAKVLNVDVREIMEVEN